MWPFLFSIFLQFYEEQQFSEKIMFKIMHLIGKDEGKMYFTSNKEMHNMHSSWNVGFDFCYVDTYSI